MSAYGDAKREASAIVRKELASSAAMRHHLRHNHFPPIFNGEEFAALAIEAMQEGEPERVIEAGEAGTTSHRIGRAGDVCEHWHLEHWLEDAEEVEA